MLTSEEEQSHPLVRPPLGTFSRLFPRQQSPLWSPWVKVALGVEVVVVVVAAVEAEAEAEAVVGG